MQGTGVVVYHHEGKGCEVTVTRDPPLVEVVTMDQALRAIPEPETADSFEIPSVAVCDGPCTLGQPLAVPLLLGDEPDMIVGGVILPWAPEKVFVLAEQMSLMRLFHCTPEASTTPTSRPERWVHMDGLQSRAEGYDGESECDPLLDDDCSIACFFATRTDVDFVVDPRGRQETLLIVRTTELLDDGGAAPSEGGVELRDEPDGLSVVGCGADFEVAW